MRVGVDVPSIKFSRTSMACIGNFGKSCEPSMNAMRMSELHSAEAIKILWILAT